MMGIMTLECLELYGKGVAMGDVDSLRYEGNILRLSAKKQLIVIGSDGPWEARNAKIVRFWAVADTSEKYPDNRRFPKPRNRYGDLMKLMISQISS